MRYPSKLAALLICVAMTACTNTESGYDQHFYDLINKANTGDIKAAEEAYDYCTAYLKLDENGLPSIYLGRCGGALAIWRDNSMQSENPEEIKKVLDVFQTSPPDYKPHLPAYYKKIAKVVIAERCSQAAPPKGCSNAELMGSFGLLSSPQNDPTAD